MQEINLILAQDERFNFVGVRFKPAFRDQAHNPKVYHYKTIEQFEVGDLAIVESPTDGFVIVEVVETDCLSQITDKYRYKWIVQKIDSSNYEKHLEMENGVVAKINSMRLKKMRREYEKELQLTLGDDGVEELNSLVKL